MVPRISLERVVLLLAAVMMIEVGYLWGLDDRPEPHVLVIAPASGHVPSRLVPPEPPRALAEVVPPPTALRAPRREPHDAPRRNGTGTGVLDACARSDDPLCGLPGR
jgi:hypothetical protein